ncbi:MAG: UPF0175 family protein [Halobacteriota archaeon]
MATHGLHTALTLYRSGTLTLAQAATRAGRSEESFRRVLDRYGIDHGAIGMGETETQPTDRSLRAD